MLHQGWLLEGWGRNVVDVSTGSVRPQGRIKEYFFSEREILFPKTALLGLSGTS